jgi:hypothetical protein
MADDISRTSFWATRRFQACPSLAGALGHARFGDAAAVGAQILADDDVRDGCRRFLDFL